MADGKSRREDLQHFRVTDDLLQQLEAELARAIEHARLARKAAKHAKAEAKDAKKIRKRALKALIEAQEDYERERAAGSGEHSDLSSGLSRQLKSKEEGIVTLGQRIADSPERKRKRVRKKKTAKTHPPAASLPPPVDASEDSAADTQVPDPQPENGTD